MERLEAQHLEVALPIEPRIEFACFRQVEFSQCIFRMKRSCCACFKPAKVEGDDSLVTERRVSGRLTRVAWA